MYHFKRNNLVQERAVHPTLHRGTAFVSNIYHCACLHCYCSLDSRLLHFSCTDCSRDAGSASFRRYHRLLVSVAGSKPYRCRLCPNRYQREDALLHHQQQHRGLTCCPLCGKIMSKVNNLRQHMAKVHKLTPEEVLKAVPDMRQGIRRM